MEHNRNETTIYRIPKHIDVKLRYWRLDIKGWIAVAIVSAICIAILLSYPTATFRGLFTKFIICAAPVFLTYLVASDETLAMSIQKSRYHARNAKVIRWESDHDAGLKVKKQK